MTREGTMLSVLLIDQEPYRIESLARGLRIAGHRVLEARTLLEALEHVWRPDAHVDIIVTDCAASILLHPMLQQLLLDRFARIQVVTMIDHVEWKQRFGNLGLPNHFLEKPFSEEELLHLLDILGDYSKCIGSC